MENNVFTKQWWAESLQLAETTPVGFEDDDNYKYISNQLSVINKAAEYFNVPISDLEYAFTAAQNVVLMDDVWAILENTNSYNIESIGQVMLYAQQHNIDIKPYLEAIKNAEPLPLPLILRYAADKYYLVAGELILSLYRALDQNPEVLQATLSLNIIEEQEAEPKSEVNLVDKFIQYCMDELKLAEKPQITFSGDTDETKDKCSFGYFVPSTNVIWVYSKDRNMADIFRTLAHELVHRKQDEDGRIDYESGDTGSEIENEANAMAGVLLRNFGKEHNNIYDTPITQYITLETQQK
jgi:Zn-dependent peptidase ImmA (M78 family)